jgi:hypothetical protein
VAGFHVLHVPEGRWPKVQHKDTDITVDILPEGKRPGTANRPAPTLIGHPNQMGGTASKLQYIDLASLIELKLAAGRTKDELDVIELLRAKPDCLDTVRQHLVKVHADYVTTFNALAARAAQDESR